MKCLALLGQNLYIVRIYSALKIDILIRFSGYCGTRGRSNSKIIRSSNAETTWNTSMEESN